MQLAELRRRGARDCKRAKQVVHHQAVADRERTFFFEVATAFRFSKKQIQDLLQWVRRHEVLMAEAEKLLKPPLSRIRMPPPPGRDA